MTGRFQSGGTSVVYVGVAELEMAGFQSVASNLEFVNDETGQVWNVKDNPTLTSIHQKGNREVKAHIEAMSSPRYLFGGSYVEIKKIETLPSQVADSEMKLEPSSKQIHVCSLDANWGKN